jgi:hypothetical protein
LSGTFSTFEVLESMIAKDNKKCKNQHLSEMRTATRHFTLAVVKYMKNRNEEKDKHYNKDHNLAMIFYFLGPNLGP